MSNIGQILARNIGKQFSCSTINNFVRIRTPYLYPDGDYIDLYLKQKKEEYILTDLGETIRWLNMQNVSDTMTEKQKELINDTLLTFKVEKYQSMLFLKVKRPEEIAVAVTDLSQAVFRISDIWFTFKTKSFVSILNDVAEFLKQQPIDFERNKKLKGHSGRTRKVDFYVKNNNNKISLVNVLSISNKSFANSRTDSIHSVWWDLRHFKEPPNQIQFISLFDDRMDIWSFENFKFLREVSNIAYWSDKENFKSILLGVK